MRNLNQDPSEEPFPDYSEREALAERLERFRPWARVFVRQHLDGRLRRRLDESDVIQAAWLAVLRGAEKFRGTSDGQFVEWIKTSLLNHIRNSVRDHAAGRRNIRLEVYPSESEATATLIWKDRAAVSEAPSHRLIRGENALLLAAAMEQLPKSQRRAVELRHLSGMKLSQIADELERTPDAVVSLIRRGTARLAEYLSERADE